MKLTHKTCLNAALAGALVFGMTIRSESANVRILSAPADRNDVTAIDTLLDPDDTMVQHATAANARLRASYPNGYTLGGAHAPHITLLQRYVKTSELDQLYAAVTKVFDTEDPRSWKLKAIKYQYFPDKSIGLANIVIEPTPDLLRLQGKLIEAEKPFEVPSGTDAAFVTTSEDPTIIPQLLPYVADFVPKYSGDNFDPHVTIGVGTAELCEQMKNEPFDVFEFSPIGASTYHLGNWGTAMKKLHSYRLK